MNAHTAERNAPSRCDCPVGFGGAFRLHRYPCPKAGSVDARVIPPAAREAD